MVITTQHTSYRAPSGARPASSSIRWCIKHCAAAWATNCMRSHSRLGRRKTEANQDQLQPRINMDITVQERIRQDVADNPVVLYMKGSPVFPQCGFSAAVVQILSHLGVKFKGVDVLADP